MPTDLIVRQLNYRPYEPVWQAMQSFTKQRKPTAIDELWFVEHPPVFTQGLAGKAEHVLDAHSIPIIQTDRGGQVTYHAPGQLVAYPLLDMKRLGYNVRQLVTHLEKTVIDLLTQLTITAGVRQEAPGVYVDNSKICSIGLRVSRGYTYHGIALNINMDLTPFSYIHPCGYPDLKMTQVNDWGQCLSVREIQPKFLSAFMLHFGYTEPEFIV